jgi:hypothetical protein
VIVKDDHVAHAEPGLRAVKIDFDNVAIYRDHPKHVIAIDVNVVIVDLQWDAEGAGRSNRTGVEIKSNEGERSVMLAPVRSDELALTEAHVGLIRKRHGCPCRRVRPGSTSTNVGKSNKAVEIGDLRRIVDVCQRICGIQRVVVNEDPKWFEPGNSTRNGIWAYTNPVLPVLRVVIVSSKPFRTCQSKT